MSVGLASDTVDSSKENAVDHSSTITEGVHLNGEKSVEDLKAEIIADGEKIDQLQVSARTI